MFRGCGSNLNLFVVLCLFFFVAGVQRTFWRCTASQKRSDCGLGQVVFCGLGGGLPVFFIGVEMIEDWGVRKETAETKDAMRITPSLRC